MFNYDIEKHNEEYALFRKECENGCQSRIEMGIACNPRIILMDEQLNPEGIVFEQYFKDPEVMLEIQCRFNEYGLNNIACDKFMGVSSGTKWQIYPDFQNTLEPSWFGCPVLFNKFQEPCARRILNDENKYDILKNGLIEPFSGPFLKSLEYLEFFRTKEKEGYTWNNVPISAAESFGLGTDGPMTLACGLRGAAEFCLDLYEDTSYALELLDFITENIINRFKVLRRYFGHPELSESRGITDDSIALLSTEDYIKYILPFHKKLVTSLSAMKKPGLTHLCGDATRHFKIMRDELYIGAFDTGFPVNHGKLVRELGDNVTVFGGVHVNILLSGTPREVEEETKKILNDVLPCKNFVMKEANNLCPKTPPENIAAMYEAVKKYGVYN